MSTPNVSTYGPWLREPARMVANLVALVLLGCAAIVELLNDVVAVLPASWRDEVRAVLAVVVLVGVIAARIQAHLTRNGIGPAGKVFDGVYAPATVQEAGRESALPPSH